MKQYNIYAGLNGSFGGANYQYTSSFKTKEEAEEDACICAHEIYESYEGLHGLKDYYDCEITYCEENDIKREDLTEENYEEIDNIYSDEVENWIDYYVILTEEDNNINEDELIIED